MQNFSHVYTPARMHIDANGVTEDHDGIVEVEWEERDAACLVLELVVPGKHHLGAVACALVWVTR
jgi:hypothetical protein